MRTVRPLGWLGDVVEFPFAFDEREIDGRGGTAGGHVEALNEEKDRPSSLTMCLEATPVEKRAGARCEEALAPRLVMGVADRPR